MNEHENKRIARRKSERNMYPARFYKNAKENHRKKLFKYFVKLLPTVNERSIEVSCLSKFSLFPPLILV
jgi:hypothetical protein